MNETQRSRIAQHRKLLTHDGLDPDGKLLARMAMVEFIQDHGIHVNTEIKGAFGDFLKARVISIREQIFAQRVEDPIVDRGLHLTRPALHRVNFLLIESAQLNLDPRFLHTPPWNYGAQAAKLQIPWRNSSSFRPEDPDSMPNIREPS